MDLGMQLESFLVALCLALVHAVLDPVHGLHSRSCRLWHLATVYAAHASAAKHMFHRQQMLNERETKKSTVGRGDGSFGGGGEEGGGANWRCLVPRRAHGRMRAQSRHRLIRSRTVM